MFMLIVWSRRGVFSDGIIATVVLEETWAEVTWIEPRVSDAKNSMSKMHFGPL